MPDGKTHLRLWKTYSFLAISISIFVTVAIPYKLPLSWLWAIGPCIFLGYLLGYYIDPDWDQGVTTASQWRIQRHLSILGSFIVGWFMPYSKVFPHRSFLSHTPVISTSVRMLWLLLFPVIFFLLWLSFGSPRELSQITIPDYFIPVMVGLLTGLSIADAIHYLADQWY